LDAIAAADDLHVSPFRSDGVTYGTPTWIWSVVVGSSLYVRAYNGHSSRWYRAAMSQRAGRVAVAGQIYDVIFSPVEVEAQNALIDEAYRKKYGTSRYLNHMIGPVARAATMEIITQS